MPRIDTGEAGTFKTDVKDASPYSNNVRGSALIVDLIRLAAQSFTVLDLGQVRRTTWIQMF